MQVLSGKLQSSIDAAVCLARHQGSGAGPINVADISTETKISISYLEQIFAILRRNHVVSGIRGPGGGYVLNRPAANITLNEFVDEAEPRDKLMLGLLKKVTLKEVLQSA